jgi:protoporphyrinogen oxidase
VKKSIAIIGAGPAGLTAGLNLSKKGFRVDIYEASSSVGGMSKTIKLWDQLVDLGPHRFFSQDPRVNKVLFEILKKDYAIVNRTTRIFYNNFFFDYPLKPFNALKGLGFWESSRCLFSYIRSKIRNIFFKQNDKKNSFEEWVQDRFGIRLFEIFFKTYSEKLWGISCKDLDSDFASQRIKKLSLFEAIKSAIFKDKKNKHKSLVDAFVYPNLGTGMIYERMSDKILNLGGKIYFNEKVKSVNPKLNNNNQVEIIFQNNKTKIYDEVISTMPVTTLVKSMGKIVPTIVLDSLNKLKFRNTILVYLEIDDEHIFPDQWIYVHSQTFKTGRITNFKNWTATINKNKKESILCMEYWANDNSALWSESDENLINLAISEILQTELVKKNKVKNGFVVRLPKCYPVYSIGYKYLLKPVEKFLNKFKNITAIGRYGSFKYNNQDHSILMGILAAENIAENKQHNLWELNNDYEYQERGELKIEK